MLFLLFAVTEKSRQNYPGSVQGQWSSAAFFIGRPCNSCVGFTTLADGTQRSNEAQRCVADYRQLVQSRKYAAAMQCGIRRMEDAREN
jgi:hypothetical protein